MSKKKTLKKTIFSCIAVWLVFTAIISIAAAIMYKNDIFHSPTEEEYTDLIEYVLEVKDNIIENKDIRDRFLSENMTDIFIETSEGDINSEIEITSKRLFIKSEKGNCIVEKEYELGKEYVYLEDGTEVEKGMILVGNDIIQSSNTIARDLMISIYAIATAFTFLAMAAIIYSEKKKTVV